MIRTPFGAMTVRWDVCLTEYSQLVRRQTGREDCRTMALSSAAVVLLTTIFVVDERASARMFTAEGNTFVMSHWERVSESGYVDDGSLIDTRKCAFAPTIEPKKYRHTRIR